LPKAKWTLVNINWDEVEVEKLTKSRSDYKNCRFWLVEKLIILRYIHPVSAWLLSSPSLPSRQANMVDSSWMNFSYIRKTSLQVHDIWKDGEFSKWLLLPLDQKFFQELIFKAFKNHKCSGCVNHQQVRSIDRNLSFFKLKLLIFKRWWQLWMKSTIIKQKYQMNLFLVLFQSFVLLPNSISKLIDYQCTCKLIIKTTAAYVYAHWQLRLCFYVLVHYFVVLDIHLWKLY